MSDSWTAGAHALTAFASWDRWKVDDVSNFGTNLDDRSSTLWGAGVQDVVTLGSRHGDRRGALRPALRVRCGVEPAGNVSRGCSSDSLWKVAGVRRGALSGRRRSASSTIPSSGNPDLEPERSARRTKRASSATSRGGRAEVSFFWNDLENLIVSDFATSRNSNIGRARTRGVEVDRAAAPSPPALDVDVSYTYARRARTSRTGRPPVAAAAAPARRSALMASARRRGWTVSPRAVFVGSRADIDGLTVGPRRRPVVHSAWISSRATSSAHFAPYARLENAHRPQVCRGQRLPRARAGGGPGEWK